MASISSNATGGGNWSATTSWAGSIVPILGDKVTIVAGDTITVDGSVAGGDDTSTAINVSGTLKASRSVSSTLRVRGHLTILTGGTRDYGKKLDPIPTGIVAKIQLNDSATLAIGKWGLTVEPEASGDYIYGATKKSNTYLTTQLLAGGTSFDVADATGWAIGDTVILATTLGGTTTLGETEERIISNIVGNTITISVATTYQHEINGRVGNFSRSVVIESYNSSYAGYQDLISSDLTTLNTREIQYVRISYLGANTNNLKYGGMRFDGSGKSTNPYTSVGNICAYNTRQYCIDVYNFIGNLILDDCSFYQTAYSSISFRQGGVATYNRAVVYRSSVGLVTGWSQGGVNCVFNDCWFIDCANTAIAYSSGQGFTFNNCTIASSKFAINLGWGAPPTLNNCAIGYLSGAYNGYNTIGVGFYANGLTQALFNSCTFNNTTDVGNGITVANSQMKVILSNKNVDPLQQEIYLPTGTIIRDNTIAKNGISSIRFNPVSTTVPLQNTWNIFAPTGQPVVASGYIKPDLTGGLVTAIKVTLSGLGITPSVYTAIIPSNATWQQFVVFGTQNTGADGILDLTIEVMNSTGGSINVDGIVAPPTIPVSSGDLIYWARGQPAKLIAANFTSPDDIWNKLTSGITLTGSIGELVKNTANKVDDNQALIISQ